MLSTCPGTAVCNHRRTWVSGSVWSIGAMCRELVAFSLSRPRSADPAASLIGCVPGVVVVDP